MTRMKAAWTGMTVAVLAAASVAVAGNREGSEGDGVAPLREHVTASVAGYRVQVHPGFSSGVWVRGAAGETQLYRQRSGYRLSPNAPAGPDRHVVRLEGGAFDRDVGLVVNDPKHQIARITVEMYGPDHRVGQPGSAVVETFVIKDDIITCPPVCLEDTIP